MTDPALTVGAAVTAARALDIETVGVARDFAESMGYSSFRTKAPMPALFAVERVLREGYQEGLSNAQCEREQVRAGLL
jgi:hypothetical protein